MRVDTTAAGYSTADPGQTSKSAAQDRHLPSRPAPCAQRAYTPKSHRSPADGLDIRDEILRRYRQSLPYEYPTSASVSSAGGSCMTARMGDSIDLEKGILGMEVRDEEPARGRSRTEMVERQPVQSRSTRGHNSIVILDDEDEGQLDVELENKAMRLLLFLSGPVAALSFIFSLWAIIAILLSLLLQPLRLCAKRPTLREQIISLLGSPLNLQLRCIYASSETIQFSPGMLVIVHLLSPLLAVGAMLWSWVVATYWLFAAMVGNPDGLDGRNDGKELVLQLRSLWEGWLRKAAV